MPAPSDRIASILSPLTPAALDPWNTSGSPPLTMTYQFAGASQPGDLSSIFTGWTAFNIAQMNAVNSVFQEYGSVVNVNFSQVTGAADPDINIGRVALPNGTGGQGGYSYSYTTNGAGQITSRTLDSYAVFNSTIDITTQANRQLQLHEIGHAMLLKHPGPYDVGGNIRLLAVVSG